MSKFLGPIHYWLYKKIGFQEELTSKMAERAALEKWEITNLDEYYLKEMPALEDVIDEGNIHGWLQGRIRQAENKFAGFVKRALDADESNIDVLKEVAYEFGKSNAMEGDVTPRDAYRILDDVLVNGMPCDRVNVLVTQEDEDFLWKQEMDIHKEYWDAVGLSSEIYYDLRSEIIRGMLSNSNLEFSFTNGSIYEIKVA